MTYQKLREVRPEPVVNSNELCTQPIHVVLDIRIQTVKVKPVVIETVQYLFFFRKIANCRGKMRSLHIFGE